MNDYKSTVRPIPKEYRGSFNNFMIQAKQAQEAAYREWQKLLAQGWVEVSPGRLRHPDRPDEEITNG